MTELITQANIGNLADLLEREGRHSGVWFGDRLIEAASLIRSLSAEVERLREGLRGKYPSETWGTGKQVFP